VNDSSRSHPWSALKPGSVVAVCSPAGPAKPERLHRGLDRLRERYEVRADPRALLSRDGFLAGDDERRAAELNAAIADPDVRAIFVARGGYGITRILDRLDSEALRADPKPIVGFSDATALLFWALERAGVAGVHGPVVTQLGELGDDDVGALFELLEGEAPQTFSGLTSLGSPRTGSILGRLLGGNLCLLTHLVGTGLLDLDGSLVLIEDVGERPYAIDRYLTHLHHAGCLAGVRGAVVGDFVGCEENKIEGSPDAVSVIEERLRTFGIPALRLEGVGHGDRNRALPFGASALLDFDAGALRISGDE